MENMTQRLRFRFVRSQTDRRGLNLRNKRAMKTEVTLDTSNYKQTEGVGGHFTALVLCRHQPNNSQSKLLTILIVSYYIKLFLPMQ